MPFSGRDPIFWQKGHQFLKKLYTKALGFFQHCVEEMVPSGQHAR
jgi:hypothetical protein